MFNAVIISFEALVVKVQIIALKNIRMSLNKVYKISLFGVLY